MNRLCLVFLQWMVVQPALMAQGGWQLEPGNRLSIELAGGVVAYDLNTGLGTGKDHLAKSAAGAKPPERAADPARPRFCGFAMRAGVALLEWQIGDIRILERPADAGTLRTFRVPPRNRPLLIKLPIAQKVELTASWSPCTWKAEGHNLSVEIPAHERVVEFQLSSQPAKLLNEPLTWAPATLEARPGGVILHLGVDLETQSAADPSSYQWHTGGAIRPAIRSATVSTDEQSVDLEVPDGPGYLLYQLKGADGTALSGIATIPAFTPGN